MSADPTKGGRRAVRVLALGSSSLLLAVGAHLIGGGGVPSAAVLVAIAVGLGLVATALTRTRCRWPVLSAVLVLEQLALHLILSATDHSLVLEGGSHAGHAVTVAGPGSGMTMIITPVMIVSHLVATLATALLLAYGEAALWRLVDAVVVVVGLSRRRLRRPRPACARWRDEPRAVVRHRVAPRRGPPAAALV